MSKVESALKDGGRVYFIDAVSKEAAISEAKKRFNILLADGMRARRQTNASLGMCVCGGPTLANSKRCSKCKARHDLSNARRFDKRNPGRAAAFASSDTARHRLAVLLEVRNEFEDNPQGFAAWLLSELAKLTARGAA